MRDEVRGACELLGLDPLHIANEGQFLAVVAPEQADRRWQRSGRRPAASEAVIDRRGPRAAGGGGAGHDALRRQPDRRHAGRRSAARGSARPRAWRWPWISRSRVEERLARPQPAVEAFFAREAHRLAEACREMSERFLRGGRLLAFGRGPYATDAQHVSVEFVHPVIVGKRALPALDLRSCSAPGSTRWSGPDDMVMGFGPPEGDPEVAAALEAAGRARRDDLRAPGRGRELRDRAGDPDPFMHQELIEILYHTLWETVHVFFEHRELGHDVGQAGFLYPFLGRDKQAPRDLVRAGGGVHPDEGGGRRGPPRSRRARGGRADQRGHRSPFASGWPAAASSSSSATAASATDANDLALDCVAPPADCRPIPAVSLAMEPARVTAIANDVGTEVVFLRQLIAQARPDDVAVGDLDQRRLDAT